MRWVLGLVLGFGLVASASAEVPQQLHYNGYLTNAVGEAVDCPDTIQCDEIYDFIFRLYGASEGGTPIWEETYLSMPIFSGSFHVVLGTVNPIDSELLDGAVWVSVKINDNVEMGPRQKVVSAAFALRSARSDQANQADNASQLGGMDAAQYATQESLNQLEATLAPVATDGLPTDLADGDDDTVAGLGCGTGMVAKATGTGAWVCGIDEEGGVTEAEVDGFVSNNGYAAQSDLTAAQATLSALQTQVADLQVNTGTDLSALQTQLSSLQGDLANAIAALEAADLSEATLRSDGDLVLQANVDALDGSLAAVAKSGGYADLTGVPADADTLASLSCSDGQVAAQNGELWICQDANIGGVGTSPPNPCDPSAVGQMYFDEATNALRVCDGVNYRKIKTCTEVCPEPSTVACGVDVEDDCGVSCGILGTGVNIAQCIPSTSSCGVAVIDGCGNDCDLVGTQCGGGQPCVEGSCVFGSCKEILDAGASTGDGTYVIDPDGLGPNAPFNVACDMTTDGGGWTLVMALPASTPNSWHIYDHADNGTGIEALSTSLSGSVSAAGALPQDAVKTLTGTQTSYLVEIGNGLFRLTLSGSDLNGYQAIYHTSYANPYVTEILRAPPGTLPVSSPAWSSTDNAMTGRSPCPGDNCHYMPDDVNGGSQWAHRHNATPAAGAGNSGSHHSRIFVRAN